MTITRKFAMSIAGTIAGLAGLTFALVPAVAVADPSGPGPESDTSQVAASVDDAPAGSDDDFPWN